MTGLPIESQPAPPTRPGTVPPAQPSSQWPLIVGIAAVVWGGIGILGSVCGLVSLTFQSRQTAAAGTQPFMPAPPPEMQTWQLAALPLGATLLVLLIIGGVRLFRRRRNCLLPLRIWAVATIVMTLVGTPLNVRSMQASLAAAPTATMPAKFESLVMGGAVLGLAAALVPPVFMLIWFARKRIKSEVAGWPTR